MHGLAFAVRFGRLVRALDPPAPVRCIVAATETDATFRFHQIRPGEQWHRSDVDASRMIVLDIEPVSAG